MQLQRATCFDVYSDSMCIWVRREPALVDLRLVLCRLCNSSHRTAVACIQIDPRCPRLCDLARARLPTCLGCALCTKRAVAQGSASTRGLVVSRLSSRGGDLVCLVVDCSSVLRGIGSTGSLRLRSLCLFPDSYVLCTVRRQIVCADSYLEQYLDPQVCLCRPVRDMPLLPPSCLEIHADA